MRYLLHITRASGAVTTYRYPSRFARALWMITWASEPVTLRMEDC